MNRLLGRLLRAPVYVYRWRLGWVLGHRFLLLTHIGRRSGRRRQTVLEVMEYRAESREAIVMSAFGRDAEWLRNIHAGSDAHVVIGSHRFAASHRTLGVAETVDVIARYERRNRMLAPIVRAVLSRLLGWRYDGSDEGQRRLAAQLPLIAFRPQHPHPLASRVDLSRRRER